MTEKTDPQLTVIIPTWNQKELLEQCLLSLRKQTVRPAVLVVDNGSEDSTASMLEDRFKEVHHLRLEKNEGFARAANLGIHSCSTPYLALLNNDTEADPGWVEAGLQAFETYPRYSFFASRLMRYFQRDRLDSAGDCYTRNGLAYKRGLGEPAEGYLRREPVLGASAGAAFYRRELFDRIGFFDEDFFMYLEDVELSLRAQSIGHRCLYLPEAVVYHIEAASDPDRAEALRQAPEPPGFYTRRRVFWITRNRWLLMILYQPLRHLPWLAYGWLKSGLFHLLKAGYFLGFCKGLGVALWATPATLRKRAAISRRRTISTRQLCQLLSKC